MVNARLPARSRLIGTALAALLILGHDVTASAAEPIGRLTGTVTGDGAPLASTWVTLVPVDRRGAATGPAQRTVTDAQGGYAFPRPPGDRVKLQVKAPLLGDLVDTYWPQAFTFDDAGAIEITPGPVTADLDLPIGGSAAGQVEEARTGVPVDGARVSAAIAGDGSSEPVGAIVPVDGPGRFALTGLPPVPLELSVSLPPGSPFLPPLADRSHSSRSLRLSGGATTAGLTIGLRRAAEISGTVRDDAGAPVAGADVRLVGCLPRCPAHATSDTMGRYRLVGVAPGTGLDVVAQPAWGLLGPWYPSREATGRVDDLDVRESDEIGDVDLTLTRPAFVSLDVLGADRGEPLRAVVRLTTTGRTYSQYFASRPVTESRDTGAPGSVEGGAAGAPPEDSVRLRVGPVPPGEYSLSLSPGVADLGYLPARWVTDRGIPATPTIRLAAGVETAAVVSLAPTDGGQDIEIVPAPSGASAGWPGLAQGFLAPTGWANPLAMTTRG